MLSHRATCQLTVMFQDRHRQSIIIGLLGHVVVCILSNICVCTCVYVWIRDGPQLATREIGWSSTYVHQISKCGQPPSRSVHKFPGRPFPTPTTCQCWAKLRFFATYGRIAAGVVVYSLWFAPRFRQGPKPGPWPVAPGPGTPGPRGPGPGAPDPGPGAGASGQGRG